MSGLAKVDAATRTVNGDINGNPSDAIITREAQIAQAALEQADKKKEDAKNSSSWSWTIFLGAIIPIVAFILGKEHGRSEVLNVLPPNTKDSVINQLNSEAQNSINDYYGINGPNPDLTPDPYSY
jgi:hypothetical protein